MALALQPTLRFYGLSRWWGVAMPAIAGAYLAVHAGLGAPALARPGRHVEGPRAPSGAGRAIMGAMGTRRGRIRGFGIYFRVWLPEAGPGFAGPRRAWRLSCLTLVHCLRRDGARNAKREAFAVCGRRKPRLRQPAVDPLADVDPHDVATAALDACMRTLDRSAACGTAPGRPLGVRTRGRRDHSRGVRPAQALPGRARSGARGEDRRTICAGHRPRTAAGRSSTTALSTSAPASRRTLR